MGEMPVQASVGYAWRIYHQLRSDLLEDQKRMQNQVTPKDGPGKSERTARWEVFQGVSYTNKKLTKLDKLTPYVDSDKRRSELKTLGIPETNEGAYRKIIYTKYQLAKPWGQKTRTSHLLLYSQQLQAGIQGNLGRRQSPQISPSQDRFPTIGASA